MDKDLEELQDFANNLNRKPEERPARSCHSFLSKDMMFSNGTKKVKSKMGKSRLISAASIAMISSDAKKN